MTVDSSKLYRARFPLAGLIAVVAIATVVFVFPSGDAATPSDSAEIQTGAVPVSGDRSDTPVATRDAVTTTVAETLPSDEAPTSDEPLPADTAPTPPLSLPAPVGGVRPAWPEWVIVSNESPGSGRYSAELTLKGKTTDDLLVWLSMQNWVLNAEAEGSASWVLSAGSAEERFSGVLEILSPTASRITLQS